MDARIAMLIVSLLAFTACEKAPPPELAAAPEPAAKPGPVKEETASFIGRVWEVVESSQVAKGSLRVFLPDGKLVMSDPNATPAFGSWRQVDDHLTIVEEGIEYPVDILELSDRAFRIRILSPGEPVEIRFAPAAERKSDTIASARQAITVMETNGAPATSLWETAWRLENLAGAGVLDRVQATLEFPSEGRVSGNGSCNRFNGIVTIEGGAIEVGGVAATRKACPEAVMRQEERYFAALRTAERFELAGDSLRIYAKDQAEPLRFLMMPAAESKPANTIARAPASAPSPLNGIWTIVAHHAPGVSALSDEQARARYGDTVRVTAGAAISSGNQCREPRYSTSSVPAAAYLATEFKLQQDSLQPLAARNQVRIMEVSCGGARWSALGATLLELDRDRALAPWDGVFFELERDRDFRAIGQEPGWQLEIRKGLEMRLTYDYGNSSVVTPAGPARVDARTGTQTYQARTESSDLRVEVVPVRCEDSMSGQPFATTVTVTLGGRTLRGCGEELATPFQ